MNYELMEIHIYFCDFWQDFNKNDNAFIGSLKGHNVIIDNIVDNKTNLVICSCFGNEHYNYVGMKKILYYSGENDFPTFLDYDYAVTHNDLIHERHIRVPLWVFYNYNRLAEGKYGIDDLPKVDENYYNRKFCADVISNTSVSWPLRFKLSDYIDEHYKKIDHGGSYKNNIGGKVDDKIKFLEGYKFSIASENSNVEGYITEKIYESFISHNIPIYLGSKTVSKDFDSASFINVNNYKTFSELINDIKKIDEDKDLYMNMLNSNKLAINGLYDKFISELGSFIENIINEGTIRCHLYGRIGLKNLRGQQ